ncbi:hypothetical protein ACFLS5_04380 [Candidatus Bipolaricaulota bacterium]
MRKTRHVRQIVGLALAMLAVSLPGGAQDQGFEIISEGVVEPTAAAAFNTTIFGTAGYSFVGTFWASAGARISFTVDAFELDASASAGTDGIQLRVGASTELFGFGTAGEVTYTVGNTPAITLRGWGEVAGIGLTANATLAGTAISVLVGGNMDLEGFGISANLGFAGGTLTTASVGANTSVGALSLSANGGWAGGQLTVGGGAGIILGPVQVTGNAGYSTGLGINAVASAGVGWDAFQATAVAMLDNTGIGFEADGQLVLGNLIVSVLGRLGGSDLSVEIGGQLPLGPMSASISVAFDNTTGLSWAEFGFEWPL